MKKNKIIAHLLSLLTVLSLLTSCSPLTSDNKNQQQASETIPNNPTTVEVVVDTESEGQIISNPVSPQVRMRSTKGHATFMVETPSGLSPTGTLIAARAQQKTYSFDSFPAHADLSEQTLGSGPLRMWMRIEWKDSAGTIRQAETFFTTTLGKVIPSSQDAMHIFDLTKFEQIQLDDALRIRIPVNMPVEGTVSVVIDNPEGYRIRNLVSGKSLTAGKHHFEWDGRREDGTQASPGEYKVRILSHPGLSYDVLYRFANGNEPRWDPYGPTHVTFRSMCSNGEKIQASAYFTEGGYSTVVMDLDGNMIHGWRDNWSLGNKALFNVSGEKQFYAIREKSDEKKDENGKLMSRDSQLQIFAFSWDSEQRGNVSTHDLPGSNRGFLKTNALSLGESPALTGAVKIGDKVYIGDKLRGGVQVYTLTEKGNRADFRPSDEKYAIPNVGCLATDGESSVYVCSGNHLGRIDVNQPGKITSLGALYGQPVYMAIHQNQIYVLNEGENQIFVYDLQGRPLRKLGEPGGDYVGPWKKEHLVHPTSLFFSPDGSLWVTEDRHSPKRLTRWDVNTGKVIYEKLGSERYGSPGGGLDPNDPTHWITQDAEWRVDTTTGDAEVIGSLLPHSREGDGSWNVPPNHNRMYKFIKQDDRTFVIGNGPASTIYELKNHRLVPLAMISTPGIYSHSINRVNTCLPLVEAYDRAFANSSIQMPGAKQNESVLMLWVDRNGNELFDSDEFEFSPAGTDSTVGYWGYALSDLSFGIQVTQDDEINILNFTPKGWTEHGVPDYSLADAWDHAITLTDELPVGATAPKHVNGFGDSFGRSINISSSPYMLAYDQQGGLDWYINNPFPGVHGSQKASLPIPGEFQGLLFSLGTAPFTETADVSAIMNNHGRIFFVTTDGVLLDELFDDIRVASTRDHSLIGGEAFGGSFQLDLVNDRYTLQAGGGGSRVYQINGLDQVREEQLPLTITDAQLVAADRLYPLAETESRVAPTLSIPYRSSGSQDWKMPTLAQWASGDWKIKLEGEYDDQNLYLAYAVSEQSPWVNNGVDRYFMFKTGDCVDFQIATRPENSGKGIGNLRILASPSATDAGKNQVVLYRHRIPEAEKATATPMDFDSPIRRYKVDDVKTLASATAEVSAESNRYLARITLPLQELGLTADQVAGNSFKADFGIIFGDRDGQINLSRVYWANKETGLVNDVPGEMMPTPSQWGTITFEPK